MLPATIPWKLLQGIALVQLYLEERWVESALFCSLNVVGFNQMAQQHPVVLLRNTVEVVQPQHPVGTIVMPPPVGEKLAIAGHVWVVLDVDRKRHLVYCEQVKGNIPAYFGLCPGDLHTDQ